MSSSKEKFSSEELQSAAPWTPPEMAAENSFVQALQRDLSGGVAEPAEVEPEPAAVVTAEALEEVQKEAYAEAAKAGHEAGYKEGFDKGNQEGYKEGYDKGFQQGYREGKEQGFSEGKTEAMAELKEKAVHLDNILSLLSEPLRQLDEQVEQELVTLAMTVARQLVRRELKTDPGQIIAVVREALALLPVSQRKATLTMHPEDAELVRSALHLDEISVPWKIVEEPLISRGGCKIETDVSRIDATVETRLAAVIATALGGDRGADQGKSE